MSRHFQPIAWDEPLERDARALIRLALAEDLGEEGDITTQATVDPGRRGAADVVAREAGVVAGVLVAELVLDEAKADASWTPHKRDGEALHRGTTVGRLEGAAADLLTCERTILNLMNRLCGVASLTRRYVNEVEETGAAVCDTRKTTPGWRRLEKFAVSAGGGSNHRLGLNDAVLIKDNHLAVAARENRTPAQAVERSRKRFPDRVIQVEVDTLKQLTAVLGAQPDIVLLDNMSNDELSEAVRKRDQIAPSVQLEASGGVTLETIGRIAATGVERISVGALTHAAPSLDLGLDWRT